MKRVHTLDLWDTIVVMKEMGPRVIEAYKELMKNQDQEYVSKVINNYMLVLNKDPSVGSNKANYVNDLEEPLWKAYSESKVDVNTDGAIFEDSIITLDKILTSGDQAHILTTGDSQWILKALSKIDESLVKDMIVFYGNKQEQQTYIDTNNFILSKGGLWVSHTEDELKGFGGILPQIIKVYIDRNPGKEDTSGLVDIYTKDMTKVDYKTIEESIKK